MFELVRHARRRLFHNELFSQGANALCAAMAAFTLLLLVGAELLNWYWVVLVPLVAAAAGVYLARRRLPGLYAVAQIIDWRLAFADAISTALFFRDRPSQGSAEVRQCQLEQAEALARTADVRRAVPYAVPRSAYVMAALALVATSLFALRYGLTRRLDLKPPLARIFQDKFSPPDRKDVAETARRKPPTPENPADDNGANVADPDQKGDGQQDSQSADAGENGSQQDQEKDGASKAGPKQQNGGESKDGQGQNQQQAEDSNSQDSGQNGSGSAGDQREPGQQQSEGQQGANNSSESGSLMSKVKDTLQNLLSKMKPQQQNNGAPPQQGANQNSKQGSGQPNNGKQNSKGGQQDASQQADAQQGQSGDSQQNSQDSQGKGSGKSDAQQASKQPGSGIGSEDGSKEIRQAEQLAAMGKISQIIGKRSANITGEATVEVQSTSQQLHTAYVQRGAQHTQGGAEISRDEIPVALQPYVEQYFDQLRKLTPAQTPAAVKK